MLLAATDPRIKGCLGLAPLLSRDAKEEEALMKDLTFKPSNFEESLNLFAPVTHVAKIKSSVLIAHGKRDNVIPMYKSEEFVKQLSKHSQKVGLVSFDTDHFQIVREAMVTGLKWLREQAEITDPPVQPDPSINNDITHPYTVIEILDWLAELGGDQPKMLPAPTNYERNLRWYSPEPIADAFYDAESEMLLLAGDRSGLIGFPIADLLEKREEPLYPDLNISTVSPPRRVIARRAGDQSVGVMLVEDQLQFFNLEGDLLETTIDLQLPGEDLRRFPFEFAIPADPDDKKVLFSSDRAVSEIDLEKFTVEKVGPIGPGRLPHWRYGGATKLFVQLAGGKKVDVAKELESLGMSNWRAWPEDKAERSIVHQEIAVASQLRADTLGAALWSSKDVEEVFSMDVLDQRSGPDSHRNIWKVFGQGEYGVFITHEEVGIVNMISGDPMCFEPGDRIADHPGGTPLRLTGAETHFTLARETTLNEFDIKNSAVSVPGAALSKNRSKGPPQIKADREQPNAWIFEIAGREQMMVVSSHDILMMSTAGLPHIEVARPPSRIHFELGDEISIPLASGNRLEEVKLGREDILADCKVEADRFSWTPDRQASQRHSRGV